MTQLPRPEDLAMTLERSSRYEAVEFLGRLFNVMSDDLVEVMKISRKDWKRSREARAAAISRHRAQVEKEAKAREERERPRRLAEAYERACWGAFGADRPIRVQARLIK